MKTDNRFLDTMRGVADLQADHLVQQYADNDAFGELYSSLKIPFKQLAVLDKTPVLDFLCSERSRPEWYSEERIVRGQRLFHDYAEEIMFLLGVMALPYCYAGSPGNKALYLSEKMRNSPAKRLMDTAEFILGVSSKGSFGQSGHGQYHINRTRMIHAIARHYVYKNAWESKWGVPINQEDLAGTNLAFSYVIINGLRMYGKRLSERQKEDFIYLWRYIGYQLHIDPELLPASYMDAFKLTQTIRKRNFRYSEEGRILTSELIEYYVKSAPGSMKPLVSAQIRYFLGPEVSSFLGLSHDNLKDTVVDIVNSVQGIKHTLIPHKNSYVRMLNQLRNVSTLT